MFTIFTIQCLEGWLQGHVLRKLGSLCSSSIFFSSVSTPFPSRHVMQTFSYGWKIRLEMYCLVCYYIPPPAPPSKNNEAGICSVRDSLGCNDPDGSDPHGSPPLWSWSVSAEVTCPGSDPCHFFHIGTGTRNHKTLHNFFCSLFMLNYKPKAN